MNVLILKSPAKINLFLEVIRRRRDGYHSIKTLFERIALFDTITLKKRSDGQITLSCSHPDVPSDASNLCFRAADMLKRDLRVAAGVRIILKKRIPVGAGLGGGSSNAASVLLGLNKLWQLKLGKDELMRYGARLGADVPFFIAETSFAVGTQRGDRIRSLPGLKPLWHLIVIPRLKISTKAVYEGLNLTLTKTAVNVNMLIHALRKAELECVKRFIFNALEQGVMEDYPAIRRIKQQLRSSGVAMPSLSGSGSAVFGLVRSRNEAARIKQRLASRRNWQVFVVRTF